MGLCTGAGTEVVQQSALNAPHLRHPTPLSPTHEPLPHRELVLMIQDLLNEVGTFDVVHQEIGLAKGGSQMFGVMGLRHSGSRPDWETLWAFRNANDYRFSASAGTGSHVFICDNLCMHTDQAVAHRHTLNVMEGIRERLSEQVLKIEDQGKELEARYDHLKGWEVSQAEADHIMMDAVRSGACPNQYLPAIDKEWRTPRHSDFRPRNAWSLMNSFTQINQDQKLSFEHQIPRTIKLHHLFDSHTGFDYKTNQLSLGDR